MRTEHRVEQRRASLLQAALELFIEKGFHETKVSDIVDRAGVAQGTFYLYFPSKRDIFYALMDLWLSEFWVIIQDAATFRPASFEEATQRAMTDFKKVFRTLADRPLLTRLMLKQAEGVGTDVSERMENFRVQMAAHVEHLFTLRQEAGLMRPFNARLIAHASIGMIERIAFRWFVMEETPHLSPDELAEELVLFQAFGMAQQATPNPEPAVLDVRTVKPRPQSRARDRR